MTSKLILEHSWLLRTEHAQYVPQGHGCNFHDRDFGFSANLIICAQLTYFAVSNALRVQLHVRACTHHFFFHSYMCDTLFLCKTTFVNMFMTSKLILEHFWLHTGRMRTRPTRSIKRGGGSQSQFEDGDFRFSANFIIWTQVTYSGSYLCMYQVSFREMIQR